MKKMMMNLSECNRGPDAGAGVTMTIDMEDTTDVSQWRDNKALDFISIWGDTTGQTNLKGLTVIAGNPPFKLLIQLHVQNMCTSHLIFLTTFSLSWEETHMGEGRICPWKGRQAIAGPRVRVLGHLVHLYMSSEMRNISF